MFQSLKNKVILIKLAKMMIMFWKTKNFKMFTDYTYARIFENYYKRMCFFSDQA